MAEVIMTCGKICSGKSTYAQNLSKQLGAVILSIDELMLSVLGNETGEMHDEYVCRCEMYLYKKSAEIVSAGTDVILDWGFWTKKQRSFAREFYRELGIKCELHYITVSDDEWRKRIMRRNAEVEAGRSDAYFIDDGLAAKFESIFQMPDESEIDVMI